ncbi:MAG: TIGR02680 family protein [Clostridia bacterium]|nr:TIGR02680 family protein [Clostridia bacterium]
MEQLNEKNRWEINKIGLLNYWWYDEEEFEFADGRLILRGTNGSGKSVTMQSFIPLLLDGNKSPERLDPFNTKARKIEDYILGYGDDIKEENTSYLYMEFFKKETNNYLTIGMGLRAKKNAPVSFWGFIIKDGRRIGKDFLLYKDMGNKIPLTKQELKNRIGEEGGKVVESQKEYAMLVNENIFGFETYAEYQEFIKLLIEIRTPKLSKDGFKPSIITEIMSNSLRGLSDEDLKAVSESLENMNKTKEQLEMLKMAEKALKQIITPYDNYNKCVLYNKAKMYHEKQKFYKKVQKESSELIEKITSTQKNYESCSKRKEEIAEKITVNEYKKKELESNELWKRKQEQHDMEKQIEEIMQELKQKEKVEDEKKYAIIKKENEEKQAKEKYEVEQDSFRKIVNDMEQIATGINYDEFFFKKDEIKLEEKYDYKYFKDDIKRYITRIENGKKALEKENLARDEYESALQNLDRENSEKSKQDSQTNKARIELQDAKENFIEEMYLWEKENKMLKIEQEDLTKISQKILSYGDKNQFDDILFELRKPYDLIKEQKQNKKAIINSQVNSIDEQIREKEDELEDWKNKKEPEPQRSKRVELNRKNLKEKGIPYIEFYNAVDFKKDLSEDEKGRIEAGLLDMGVLDSIIIPKEYRNKIKQLDIEFVDRYLFEEPQEFKQDLSLLLDVKLPQDSKIEKGTVYNVLKSIMIEEKSGTYVNEKGEYKIGVLEGLADKNEKAKYIGSEARKEFKEKQIEILQAEINTLNEQKNEYLQTINQLENSMKQLNEEYEKFPTKQKLEETYNSLKVNINKLAVITENIGKLENILQEKLNKLKEAKEETLIATKNLNFPLTLESYANNLEEARSLNELVYEMEKVHNNSINEFEKIEGIRETLDSLRQDLDDILYEKGKLSIKKNTISAKLDAIKQMSDGLENIEKQMEEVLHNLEVLPKEKEKLIADTAKLENEISKLQESELNIAEKLKILERQTKISKEIFEQELNLKYVLEEYEEIGATTNKIVAEFSYFDKENKSKEDYHINLVDKYRENSESLRDYNLNIGNLFVQEVEVEDSEQLELEKTRTRSDINCFVNGKKVNLKFLKKYIEETIEETSHLVEDEDRNLFEEILIGAVGRKIRERIYYAQNWVNSMNKLMKSLNTSSGLSFSLNWKPKLATTEEEMNTKEIVDILSSDVNLLRDEQIKKVATHFRKKFKQAEKEFAEKGEVVPFYNIMKDTLDYRKWFEFQFMYKKANEQSKELTNNAFYKLSGGEKAMAMYIPLFASVCARYQSARKDCARIISLDEAFAGVDDNNIRDMFRILTELELEYVINSQVLWGEYDTVPSLAICELISDVNNKVVSIIRYHWNGKKRELKV